MRNRRHAIIFIIVLGVAVLGILSSLQSHTLQAVLPETVQTSTPLPSVPAPTVTINPTRNESTRPARTRTLNAIPGRPVATGVGYCTKPRGEDPRRTTLDIYSLESAHNAPVLIYVHGGGWASGDCSAVGAKATYFPRHGMVFVSVNYRLLPAAQPAEQAADLATAVAWVKNNIEAYGGDGNRIFLLGHSAGAHLSALIASDESYLAAEGLDLKAIRGVILLDSAAYDVEQLMRSPDGGSEIFRQAFGLHPASWRAVSPRAYVAPGKGIPPHLLLLATATGQRRPAAEGLAAALRDAGVYAHVVDATAFRDHVTIDTELGQPGDTPTQAVQEFLDMLLAGPPIGLGGQEVLQPGTSS